MGAFMGQAMDFASQTKGFLAFVKEAKEDFSVVENWGSYGLCWGGKVYFTF